MSEICKQCDKSYNTIWQAPDWLWKKITGCIDGEGLICIDCFTYLAEIFNIKLYWSCDQSHYPIIRSDNK